MNLKKNSFPVAKKNGTLHLTMFWLTFPQFPRFSGIGQVGMANKNGELEIQKIYKAGNSSKKHKFPGKHCGTGV